MRILAWPLNADTTRNGKTGHAKNNNAKTSNAVGNNATPVEDSVDGDG